jgi:hypothetical protein
MKRLTTTLSLFAIALAGGAGTAHAQQTVVSTKRSIQWSVAGIPGGIPNRTTNCATLNPGATAAQINSAIAACPSGQVVSLNAGTYSIGSPGIVFQDKSNVTLRGAGPTQTILNFTGSNNCGGMGGDVCFINGDPNWSGAPGNTANWTAGYAKGSTVLTLSSTSNLKVGSVMILDQTNDSNTDNGGVWVCGTGGVCAQEGQSGHGRSGRYQQQLVNVTAINGSQVTISPGVYMPNWRSSQSPQAWWSDDLPIMMSGIEGMTLNHGNSGSPKSGIYFFNAKHCWVKNVKSTNSNRNHVWLYQSNNNVVRDSYFYGTKAAESESYGVEYFQASDNLVENNIFQHIATPMMNVGGTGGVFAYNYSIDDFYNVSGWAQASSYHHAAGNSFTLWEGNDGFGMNADNIHGTSHFITAFRNRWHGWETSKSQQTVPVFVYAFSRFDNIVGNVLGTDAYHTNYQSSPGASGSCNKSIFAIGWGGNCGSGSVPNDNVAVTSLMRWGNYDVVNDAARFVASEVPTSALHANPVPPNQTLPASFYLVGHDALPGGRSGCERRPGRRGPRLQDPGATLLREHAEGEQHPLLQRDDLLRQRHRHAGADRAEKPAHHERKLDTHGRLAADRTVRCGTFLQRPSLTLSTGDRIPPPASPTL